MKACKLDGVGVLVTRPSGLSEPLAGEIRQHGGEPVMFPGLQIEPLIPEQMQSLPPHLIDVDLVVFVSPTSVRLGLPAMHQRYGALERVRIAAVGQSTADGLKEHGFSDVIAPIGSSGARALVDCPQLHHVSGWTVLVVRGEGGSDELDRVLRGRGANVVPFECYRRCLPQRSFSHVEPLLRNGRIGAWMATSGEILDNMFHLAGEHGELLRTTPLFVNHPHVAARGFSRSVKVIFVTTGGDNGLMAGLLTWFCRRRDPSPLTEVSTTHTLK
ncbi:MAG: uroporphyrinogen-III synthase [Burkholderiales bacterium]